MASLRIFLRRDILGFSLFLCAKLLVTIPSYVYFSDGYNQGVGKGLKVVRRLIVLLNELLSTVHDV